MTVSKTQYDQNVFINCPFDSEYTPLFEAIVFAVADCGFRPTCARERMNSGQVRLEKIIDFRADLPRFARLANLNYRRLTFVDYCSASVQVAGRIKEGSVHDLSCLDAMTHNS